MSSNVADSFDFDADNFADEGKNPAIGKTSSERPSAGSSGSTEPQEKKQGFLSSFSLWDGLLLISLICVTLATLRVYFSLVNEFDAYFFTWRVN